MEYRRAWRDSAREMKDLEALLTDLRTFVAERDWAQFHDPKNLAMLLASEAGELVAEYRWVRGADADAHSRAPECGRAPEPRARIADEVADVGIALLLLCDRIGLDLPQAIADKLAKNVIRYPADLSRGHSDRPA
jgi:dCTP diphosphatase